MSDIEFFTRFLQAQSGLADHNKTYNYTEINQDQAYAFLASPF